MAFKKRGGTQRPNSVKCGKSDLSMIPNSAKIYLFKVNNRNTRKGYEICSKFAIKTPE